MIDDDLSNTPEETQAPHTIEEMGKRYLRERWPETSGESNEGGAPMNEPRNMDEEILVEMFIEAGESTPHFFLEDACARGDLVEARRILDSGVSFLDEQCWRPTFFEAVQNENTDVLDLLVEHGIKFHAFQAVTEAIKAADHPHMLEYIITQGGADPSRLHGGWTPLQFAARFGRRRILEWLIESCDVDPCSIDPNERTVLMLAALSNEGQNTPSPALEYLLGLGRIDVNAQDHHGRTSLMRAAQYGLLCNTSLLLQRGAKPNDQDHKSRTAMMLACVGAPPDNPNSRNRIACDSATRFVERELVDIVGENYPRIVGLLLSSGAHPQQRDARGLRAIDHAHARGAEEIVSLLWA